MLLCLFGVIFPSAVYASDPNMVVEPNALSFVAYEAGNNPDPQTLIISNPGSGILDWTADTTGKPDWLMIMPVSGSLGYNESEVVTLSADITGLPGGSYSYAFMVSVPGAQNSPKTVTVNLQVTGPILNVSKSSISFSVDESDPNPNPQTLIISNTGGGTLNWSVNLTSKPDWLIVSPTGGSLGPNTSEPVTLSVDITGLSKGQYSYTFQVTNLTAQDSPQTITVYLIIGYILVPGDYATIQAAIDAAIEADTIIVLPGRYYENINFKGKNIILTSVDPQNRIIVEDTIIDGG